jgi:hypothetical protein
MLWKELGFTKVLEAAKDGPRIRLMVWFHLKAGIGQSVATADKFDPPQLRKGLPMSVLVIAAQAAFRGDRMLFQ